MQHDTLKFIFLIENFRCIVYALITLKMRFYEVFVVS